MPSQADLAWDFEDGGPGRLLLLATRTQGNLAARPFRDYLTPLQQAWPELERADGTYFPEEAHLVRQLEELYHLEAPHRIVLRLIRLAQERPSGLLARALSRAIREHLQMFGVPELAGVLLFNVSTRDKAAQMEPWPDPTDGFG